MYEVVGAEHYHRSRLGVYKVLFRARIPGDVRHVYLVSELSSYYIGRHELAVNDGVGEIVLDLLPGTYPYFFGDERMRYWPDEDVATKTKVRHWGITYEASVARVPPDDFLVGDPLDYFLHNEGDPRFLSHFAGYVAVRAVAHSSIADARLEVLGCGERTYPMRKYPLDSRLTIFEGIVPCDSVSGYVFRVRSADGEEAFFGEGGAGDDTPIRPMHRPSNVKWFHGALYYQIFVDSFASSTQELPPRHGREVRLGGDLLGIVERLGHIESLGAEVLYLTPIYVAPSYHRYDVIDHKRVDPYLGGDEAFRALITKAHERGIRVVIDLVAHHVSPCSTFFVDALRRWRKSEYWGWFRFLVDDLSEVDPRDLGALWSFINGGCRELPREIRGRDSFYEGFFNLWIMPKLDYGNEGVREYVCDVVRHWLGLGVDGVRVDVALGIPDEGLERIWECVKEAREDAAVIIEVSRGVPHHRYGYTADGAMNYDLMFAVRRFIGGSITAREFVDRVASLNARIPLPSVHAMYNLLDSHDTDRAITALGGVEEYMRALTILFALPGSPALYYGDEVGMGGGGIPYCRETMVWDEGRWNKDIFRHVKFLAYLRRRFRSLRLGYAVLEPVNEGTVAIHRYLPEEEFLAIVPRPGWEFSYELEGRYSRVAGGEVSGAVYRSEPLLLFRTLSS